MKSLKTYLIVVSLILLSALVLGVYVWYKVQQTHVQIEKIGAKEVVLPKTTETETHGTDTTVPSTEKETPATGETTTTPAPEVTKPIVVDTTFQ